jgi:beta-galactosidase/beta-glucuronidase
MTILCKRELGSEQGRKGAQIMKIWLTTILLCITTVWAVEVDRHTLSLNGTWQFEQTRNAFPPKSFRRTIPVPGLIHLAEPQIDQYALFFRKPDTVENVAQYDLLQLHYEPRYNWYKKTVTIPAEYKELESVLTLKKSMYVTQVYVNGIDVGGSMACYTPIDCHITKALRFGAENEILIRCGDRAWLPPQAAGSTDKEKINYLAGIWDDVSISFTGKMRAERVLVLPDAAAKKATVKIKIRSFYPSQTLYGTNMWDSCRVQISIFEKRSGRSIGSLTSKSVIVKRDNLAEVAVEYAMPDGHLWSPEDPFLYAAAVDLFHAGGKSDHIVSTFGLRDFSRDGKLFSLNGSPYILRGTNITLHRFFEDPDCRALPWDRKWVTRLMATIPKQLHWNAMRVCVGITPDFWYDIADSSGLLLQNEWLYWQTHGWDDQIRTEYTDWVWSDGHHPSIAVWDAINENWDPFIGNVLIPDLKKLDPTRIWDAGYMTAADMATDEMDEPHPYMAGYQGNNLAAYAKRLEKEPYRLGDLQQWPADRRYFLRRSSAQLVNEYGWIWLWRDGRPAKLTLNQYNYFAGKNATAEERRELQAYWLQLETEWLRCERSFAGVLAFCYLANNYGFTGDWFLDPIKELKPGPTLQWFRHAFAPAAVFIDLVDSRYLKYIPPFRPGETLTFNLVGVNDNAKAVAGLVKVDLINESGQSVAHAERKITIAEYGKKYEPVALNLPGQAGGYVLCARFIADGSNREEGVLSRRFLRVGEADSYHYYQISSGRSSWL